MTQLPRCSFYSIAVIILVSFICGKCCAGEFYYYSTKLSFKLGTQPSKKSTSSSSSNVWSYVFFFFWFYLQVYIYTVFTFLFIFGTYELLEGNIHYAQYSISSSVFQQLLEHLAISKSQIFIGEETFCHDYQSIPYFYYPSSKNSIMAFTV